MKIAYRDLIKNIKQNPSIEELSEKLFQLGHEHEINCDVFNFEFTPNRGDCLSVKGLLRDLSAFYIIENSYEEYNEDVEELNLNFVNLSKNVCPHISFLLIEIDKNPKEYNTLLNNYFLDFSLNKNNFFTDVSNYLSYETGQPTHCYDATKLNGELIFQEIDTDQEFETLAGKKIKITKKNAVFLNNNHVINLAGIIGGKSTACNSKTKTVLVECAYFEPEVILGKSVKYDIQSEASYKFERGVDPKCQESVLRRFIQIVQEHTNIKKMSMISYNFKDHVSHMIPINLEKINSIIGIKISELDLHKHLLKLGIKIQDNHFIVPSHRNDLRTQNDLAEEVARSIGYNNIPSSEIKIPLKKKCLDRDIENKIRHYLLDHGFFEVINPPFVKSNLKNAIKVDNPLDSNRAYIRTDITSSLLENLLYNENRQKDSIKLFEISDIYSYDYEIKKKRKLCLVGSGRVGLNHRDFSKKINKEYLVKIFKDILPIEDLNFKTVSRDTLHTKIKNEIISLEIDIDLISSKIYSYNQISQPPKMFNQYKPISEQPSSFKDISYAIKDHNKAYELQNFLLNYKNKIIKKIYIFDFFNNEDKEEIKIGFRFIFQSQDTTLTNAEIDIVYNDIISQSLCIEGVEIPGI